MAAMEDQVAASGTAPAAQGSASSAMTSSELRTLYLDLLRRPPFDGERAAHASSPWSPSPPAPPVLGEPRTDDGSVPGSVPGAPKLGLVGLATALMASRDFWQQWYEEQLYYFLLVDNFSPRAENMLTIPDELTAGTLSVRDAVHRIALSSNFEQRNPGADTFVTVVMEQIAGLAVEKNRRELEIGKGLYDGKPGTFLGRPGSRQSDVVSTAIELRSFAETFLAREYRRYVHAAPERSELTAWVAGFQADAAVFPELVRGWISSSAYRARLGRREVMDNRLFVRSLIVDLCQREPSIEEFSRMRSALDGLSDPQPLRSVMARLLIDSDQTVVPASKRGLQVELFVEEQFRRLLGRAPKEKEAAAFVAALGDSAGKPAMIVYALVAHPEYQSY